ncbi:arylamine N-acetyltransferase [Microvirga terricola]|uniref:Arylamine N-acetyltransferase n=1 Tax=Microvirga terricola TaxID=2719797 RepID=A0ABX0V5Z6_9HYPH|nr:arylamine N-acetyltransferase [Microvirga terricola]NIX75003.1 arylamine N-acetyltransferase [Microvirga terricola]
MVSAISRYLIDFQVDGAFDNLVHQERERDSSEPIEDTASLVREAEERVRKEERANSQAKFDEAIAVERARADQILAASREEWIRDESEKLAIELSGSLRAIEGSLISRIARLLAPFLTERMCARVLDDLRATLMGLADGGGVSMTIRGSEDLLSALKEKLGNCLPAAEFVPDGTSEIRVAMGDAVIETQFATWTQRLADAVRQD